VKESIRTREGVSGERRPPESLRLTPPLHRQTLYTPNPSHRNPPVAERPPGGFRGADFDAKTVDALKLTRFSRLVTLSQLHFNAACADLMARANGFGQVNGEVNGEGNGRSNGLLQIHELPPSTIASHLPTGYGQPSVEFDRDSFNHLLEVSLGDDENGQPNLRDDAEENHKLIRVVIQAGIDPIVSGEDNPFRAQPLGREAFHITRCIEVLRLAVERSPRVLFTLSQSREGGSHHETIPLYVWLISKILPLISNAGLSQDPLWRNAHDFMLVCLLVDARCDVAGFNCGDIHTYVRSCVDGMCTAPNVQASLSLFRRHFGPS